jgi:hypothetical protein
MNLRLLCVPLLLLAACGHDHDHPHNPDGSHPPANGPTGGGDHDHANMIDLGTSALGDWQVHVHRGKSLDPGSEAEVDLDFAGDKALPSAVRAWIGDEKATGSRKGLAKPEGARGMHVHVEVPKPVAEESKLWLEVDGGARAAIDLKINGK